MKVLLAEDEKTLSKALTAILQHNNYTVDAVYDGQDALDYLNLGDYDVAVLDIMMPKLDGISVLKEVRKNGNRTPIILLTAKSAVDDKVLGLDSGADDYLTKPFVTQELLARIRAITRRGGPSPDNLLSFGNVKLDRATYELSVGDGFVKLGHKEFQMMEMLLSNKGVVSADKIMEKVWGYDSDAELSVVWVYLSYIRKKLAKLGADVNIKAIRNVGYILEKIND